MINRQPDGRSKREEEFNAAMHFAKEPVAKLQEWHEKGADFPMSGAAIAGARQQMKFSENRKKYGL